MAFEMPRGKMKNAGTELPVFETAAAKVTSVPLLAEVTVPNCLNPILVTIFVNFAP